MSTTSTDAQYLAKPGYLRSFKRYGNKVQSLQWKNEVAQSLRFQVITKYLNFTNKTILDAGCGFGDLYGYLLAQGYKSLTYLGLDILPEFIETAKAKYPEANFQVGSVFVPVTRKFDLVISSGILNGSQDKWLEYRKRAIRILFSLAGETLAFNMAGGHYPSYRQGKIGYANVDDILNYCLSLTKNVSLDDSYRPNDFTIFMHKMPIL